MGSLETTRPRSVETAFTVLAAAVEAVVVEVESAAAVEAVVVEVDSVRRSRQGIQTTGTAVMVSMGVTCSVLTVDAQYTSFATTGLPPLQVNFLYPFFGPLASPGTQYSPLSRILKYASPLTWVPSVTMSSKFPTIPDSIVHVFGS